MLLSGAKVFVKYKAIQLRKFILSNFPSLISFYYQHLWNPKPNSLAEVLHNFSHSNKEVFFIQVGSNDGFQHDPLCKFIKRDRWKGVQFEPQKKAFNTLSYIYKKDDVISLNKAIDHTINTKKLYKIAFTDARWASGLSSFDPTQLEQKVADGYVDKRCKKEGIATPKRKEDYVTYEDIQCTTFQAVFDEFNVQRVDLLQIDTEGYDFEILKMFDFNIFKPQLVIFEKTHLSESTYKEAQNYLKEYGYDVQERGADAIGILSRTQSISG